MNLQLQGQVGRAITNGDYEAVIKFNGFQILDKKGQLSDLGIPLPIPAGSYGQNFSFTVPSWIPAGQVDAHVTLFDQSGAECVCVDVSIPLKLGEFSIAGLGLEELQEEEYVNVRAPIPYKNCGASTDIAKITNAQADPWPPQKGKQLYIVGNATLSAPIPDGNYEVKVKWSGIQILDQKGKISQIKGIVLPIPAGPYGIAQKVDLPGWVPSGQIDVHAEASSTAPGNPRIACLELSINIK